MNKNELQAEYQPNEGLDIGKASIVFAAALLIAVILYLAYPNTNKHYHIVLTGMSKGRIWPFTAKFKPYTGKRVGGYAGVYSALKNTIKGFENDPYNIFSIGSELSGTAETYFSEGSIAVEALNRIGVDAMLLSNIDFSFGQERLLSLFEQANFWFIGSNIYSAKTHQTPPFAVSEAVFNPGGGIKTGVLGISPIDTPNLTALTNVEGLEFKPIDETLKKRVDNMRQNGVGVVVLLTTLRFDKISNEDWRQIAIARPDVCVMIDYDIEEPRITYKDGVVIKTVSGYNQTKELDVIDLELNRDTLRVVAFKSRRIVVDHAEIKQNEQLKKILTNLSRESQDYRSTVIGRFGGNYARSWNTECPIGNFICDAMREQVECDLAINNSGGIRKDIRAGDFTIDDLFSMLPFDNRVVTMNLTGKELRELFKLSASLQRGLLQISGGDYTFKNIKGEKLELVSFNIGGKPVDDNAVYKVCTNSFLADGGDRFTGFKNGTNVCQLEQQREFVKRRIIKQSSLGPIKLKLFGRIIKAGI